MRLALTSMAAGTTYRLNADFSFMGPESGLLSTADSPPEATELTADLAAGSYAITLEPGYSLERDVGGTFEPVDPATVELLSPNPRVALIEAGLTTQLIYRFGVGGGEVGFGEGEFVVGVAVEDQTNGPVTLAAGARHTCALMANGAVRCWGEGFDGRLGYPSTSSIGDNETPASAGDVDVGGVAKQVAGGYYHTCALLDTGAVRCWGSGASGQLGYGNTNAVGDDETPASAGDVDVGGVVVQVAAGFGHTCAVLESGAVRCWGASDSGQLGYGNTNSIGDDETPASAGDIDVGGFVTRIVVGSGHTCALLDTGAVRCWGFGGYGALGRGNTDTIGDDEAPSSGGNVELGGLAVQLAAASGYVCALLDSGAVRCWGFGSSGGLGYGNTENVGDDETPADVGDIDVGGAVAQVATGEAQTCAILAAGTVRCWGNGTSFSLGYGNPNHIGDDETPASAGDVDVGEPVRKIALGANHTCALLDTGAARCWGTSISGQLGYGNTDTIGDDETPASAGDVDVGYSQSSP